MKTIIKLKDYFPREFRFRNIGTRATVVNILKGYLDAEMSLSSIEGEESHSSSGRPFQIEIDFSEINFVSRSAVHEFLKQEELLAQEGITLLFVNMNPQILNMFECVRHDNLKNQVYPSGRLDIQLHEIPFREKFE
ncbi:MAG: STAS domain-containing protein [Thermoflavifilum aggregans]|nr:STAS domain-containing protein [Thermoflavifilum aggregans]